MCGVNDTICTSQPVHIPRFYQCHDFFFHNKKEMNFTPFQLFFLIYSLLIGVISLYLSDDLLLEIENISKHSDKIRFLNVIDPLFCRYIYCVTQD